MGIVVTPIAQIMPQSQGHMASVTDTANDSCFWDSSFFIANGALILFEEKGKQLQEMNQGQSKLISSTSQPPLQLVSLGMGI